MTEKKFLVELIMRVWAHNHQAELRLIFFVVVHSMNELQTVQLSQIQVTLSEHDFD